MEDVLEVLGKMGIEMDNGPKVIKNANEVMNTDGTNRGKELVPVDVLAQEIFDAIPEYSTFLGSLPGFHGNNMDKTMKVPVIGDVGLMSLKTQKTTGALALAQGNVQGTLTDEVQVDQKKLFMSIDVSNELSKFNVEGAEKFEATLKEKIGKAAARTVEAAIINGDTETGGTGNVNKDDGAPGATSYYLGYDGLRKDTIVTNSKTVNAGTLDITDFASVMNLLGDYAADPNQCLWLFNRQTYNKALLLSDFSDASKAGKESTLSTAAIMSLLGSDLFIPRDLGKSEADGKQSATPGNNTLGQFIYFWKPSVQYGYGGQLELRLFDMGVDGYQLQGWLYFGFGLVSQKAGVTDAIAGTAINVTV